MHHTYDISSYTSRCGVQGRLYCGRGLSKNAHHTHYTQTAVLQECCIYYCMAIVSGIQNFADVLHLCLQASARSDVHTVHAPASERTRCASTCRYVINRPPSRSCHHCKRPTIKVRKGQVKSFKKNRGAHVTRLTLCKLKSICKFVVRCIEVHSL